MKGIKKIKKNNQVISTVRVRGDNEKEYTVQELLELGEKNNRLQLADKKIKSENNNSEEKD